MGWGKTGKRAIYKRTACCKVFVEYAKRVENKGSEYTGTAITSKICMTYMKIESNAYGTYGCRRRYYEQASLWLTGQFMVNRPVYDQQASLWSTGQLTVNYSQMRHSELFCWPSFLSKHFPDHVTWRLLETNICAWTGHKIYISLRQWQCVK